MSLILKSISVDESLPNVRGSVTFRVPSSADLIGGALSTTKISQNHTCQGGRDIKLYDMELSMSLNSDCSTYVDNAPIRPLSCKCMYLLRY